MKLRLTSVVSLSLLMVTSVFAASQNVPFYVLDGFGGIHAANGAPALYDSPYWGFDLAEDLEITEITCEYPVPETGPPVAVISQVEGYVLDHFGGVWLVSSDPQGTQAVSGTPYFGYDIARDIEVLVSPSQRWINCSQ